MWKDINTCIYKSYSDKDVTLVSGNTTLDACKSKVAFNTTEKPVEKTLKGLATTDTALGVSAINACATTGTCTAGTTFAIKVSPTETYKFYVIKDDGNKVILQMNKNVGATVA